MTKRERLYPEIKRLREAEGLMWREIGERLELSLTTVHQYYSDPDGSKVAARKAKTNGVCIDCGGRTVGDGSTTPMRCRRCNGQHERALTRQYILDSFADWFERFGVPPAAYEWNPALCRAKSKRPDDCFARGLARNLTSGRPWPPLSSVHNHFGSWNEGLRAAGLRVLAPNERWVGHRGIAARDEDQAVAA
jgi:hypothetical protein